MESKEPYLYRYGSPLGIGTRPIRFYIPQTLPDPQDAAELAPIERDGVLPATFDAKVDIFFFTWLLPHTGQMTPERSVPKIKSSNGLSHSSHTNSNIGMVAGLLDKYYPDILMHWYKKSCISSPGNARSGFHYPESPVKVFILLDIF